MQRAVFCFDTNYKLINASPPVKDHIDSSQAYEHGNYEFINKDMV